MDKSIDFDRVADIYDYYVNLGYDTEFYLQLLKGRDCQVLELMCGTGRVSLPLIENGVNLTCVDYAAKMLSRLEDKLAEKGLARNWSRQMRGALS